jgi:hypothetical protein
MKRIRIAEKNGMFLDGTCLACNNALNTIKKARKEGNSVVVEFIPDFNTCGIITHHHLKAVMPHNADVQKVCMAKFLKGFNKEYFKRFAKEYPDIARVE